MQVRRTVTPDGMNRDRIGFEIECELIVLISVFSFYKLGKSPIFQGDSDPKKKNKRTF
ncbi:hypothetical protein LEP1GSC061_2378 [Leptospira wolffii serovar Khorat str. Khorat-H2]|nr:hypothetical protein LEP1GSC061_2378 [Leptospira wolffii serovar Khorat str. Khorat-H2]